MFSVLHSFVNLFAGGRSSVKGILFVFFVAALFFIVTYLKNIKPIGVRWFVLLLSCLYGFGLGMHIFLLKAYNISIGTFIITANNNEISSSIINHIHEAKVFIGGMLQWIKGGSFATFDAGSAYFGLFPQYLVVIGGLLLVGVVVTGTFLINRYYGESSPAILGRRLFVLWYGIVVFSLIKGAIDGGILSLLVPTVVLAIAFFLYLKKGANHKLLSSVVVAILFGCVASLVFPTASWVIVFTQCMATFCLLGFLALFITKTKPRMYGMYFIVLFLMSWWLASVRDRALHTYGSIEIERGQEYFIFNRAVGLVEKQSAEKTITVKALAKQYNENISYGPVTVPGTTCFTKGEYNKNKSTILTKQQFNSLYTQDISVVKTREFFDGVWWRSNIDIGTPPCLPEPLSVFDREMRKHGFDFYVMVEKQRYDDTLGI